MSFSTFIPTSNYSTFRPTPPTQEEREEQIRLHKLRQEYIQQYAEDNNLVLLKSNYWGMDKFYYSEKYNRMYIVHSSDKSLTPPFELSHDENIMEINGITY